MAQRVLEDTKIDLNCVAIKVNGIVNSPKNRRCENYKSEDGFVYTNSYKEENGEYYYQNRVNASSGTFSDKIKNAAEDSDIYTNMNVIRNNNKNEAIINYAVSKEDFEQFNGKPTKNFMYNEGNQPNVSGEVTPLNGKVDFGRGPGTTSNERNEAGTNSLSISYNSFVKPSVLHIRNL